MNSRPDQKYKYYKNLKTQLNNVGLQKYFQT